MLRWSNGDVWLQQDPRVASVHVVYMTHRTYCEIRMRFPPFGKVFLAYRISARAGAPGLSLLFKNNNCGIFCLIFVIFFRNATSMFKAITKPVML